jgi:hypothetical protein
MRNTVLTTSLYKYNPYARFYLLVYVFFFFMVCWIVSGYVASYIIWMVIDLAALPLLYGAISQKTIFNFRAWDSRQLRLSATTISIGDERFAISDVKIELEINAYDGFIYHIRRNGLVKPQATYGKDNFLYIHHKGSTYDAEFHLRDYDSYTTLCQLADEWKAAGAQLTVKEAFTREFVHKQHAAWLKKARQRAHLNG